MIELVSARAKVSASQIYKIWLTLQIAWFRIQSTSSTSKRRYPERFNPSIFSSHRRIALAIPFLVFTLRILSQKKIGGCGKRESRAGREGPRCCSTATSPLAIGSVPVINVFDPRPPPIKVERQGGDFWGLLYPSELMGSERALDISRTKTPTRSVRCLSNAKLF